jgi:hypothetical protein
MLFVKAISCVSVFFTFCWNNIQLLAFIIGSWQTKRKIFQLSCAIVMTCVFLRICTRIWVGIYSSAPLKLSLRHVFWIIAIYHAKILIIKDTWCIWTSSLSLWLSLWNYPRVHQRIMKKWKPLLHYPYSVIFSPPSFKPKDRYGLVDTFLRVFISYRTSRLFYFLRQIPSPFVM